MPDADDGAARAGHNGMADKGKSFVERIENLNKDLESERGTYMAACKTIREDIKAVLGEAKDAGIPKKAIKAVVATRALERKLEDQRDDLDIADRDTFDNIRMALGDLADLPLGEAALDEVSAARAAKKRKSPAAEMPANAAAQ